MKINVAERTLDEIKAEALADLTVPTDAEKLTATGMTNAMLVLTRKATRFTKNSYCRSVRKTLWMRTVLSRVRILFIWVG